MKQIEEIKCDCGNYMYAISFIPQNGQVNMKCSGEDCGRWKFILDGEFVIDWPFRIIERSNDNI